EKQRQAKYDFDEEQLRPYFPLDGVLQGLFDITTRVFGVTVKAAQAPGWHPDVRYYDIHDEAGVHVASFYTDWFPRDTKRGGAWMNAFFTGGPREGGVEPHLGLMCGNMTPPLTGTDGSDTPALLSISEVETVFHEFGHLLHHALSRVPVKSLAGTSVAWDFVELPSQIMENWVMEREALDLFGRHYQTGERIPDDLFGRMIAARNYRSANHSMRQYSFGLTDLTLHALYDPTGDSDPIKTARDVMARFYPYPLPDDYAMIASFGHLFSSPVGYGAGYYSYKWAEVLDADAFTRFAKEGIFNRETGRAFVDAVLSRGNSEDPAELYREFMGRDPDPDALLRRSGILVTS
uniref:M3 family metallopeptidase n=1 Tax=Deinococcus sp. TaxID=47478 RepID=UPI002869AC12